MILSSTTFVVKTFTIYFVEFTNFESSKIFNPSQLSPLNNFVGEIMLTDRNGKGDFKKLKHLNPLEIS
jgi:hypothetical protein